MYQVYNLSGGLQSRYLQTAVISLIKKSDNETTEQVVPREDLLRCFRDKTVLTFSVQRSDMIFTFSVS